MGYECRKAVQRRLVDSRFMRRYFVGHGLDVGAGTDGLGNYAEFFPLIESVRDWDVKDGDAQELKSIPDETYDFVVSSHCLEHIVDPYVALRNWLRVLKPGGHLVVLIPDEDLYEQGKFPSRYNGDHKVTFTIFKSGSWCSKSINVITMLSRFNVKILKIELLDSTFSYKAKEGDQTGGLAECAIEFIVQKL
jgi:SAM-dependent methyltransferase